MVHTEPSHAALSLAPHLTSHHPHSNPARCFVCQLLERNQLAVWDSEKHECGGVLLKRPLPNSLKKEQRKSGWLKKAMRSSEWEPRYFQVNTHGVKGLMDLDDNYSLRYYSPKDTKREAPLIDLNLAGARIVKKDPEIRKDNDGKLVFPFEVRRIFITPHPRSCLISRRLLSPSRFRCTS